MSNQFTKITKENSLATTHPEIAKQWHPTKNGNLTPYDVSKGSNKKVWWKCPKGDDHEWESQICNRSNRNRCPICSNRKIILSNCLATLNPNLAKEFHPIKNKNITPFNISLNYNKSVWWKCPKGDDHEWFVSPNSRNIFNSGCPICSGKKVVKSNSLGNVNPNLAKEWHPTKNGGKTPFDYTEKSSKKVWWKCPKGDDHEWESQIINRSIAGHGCSICNNRTVVNSNCLATQNPNLAKEWHPTKNGKLTPYDVVSNTHKSIWWKCNIDNKHIWKSSVANRNRDRGCPMCAKYGFDISKVSYLYVHLIYEKITNKNIALKFGITNNYGQRIKIIKRKLDLYSIKNIYYFESDGKEVLDIENKIKKTYKTSYLNEEIMKDGYTETIKYSDKILVEIYNLCNKKMKFKSGKKLYMKRLLNIFN